MLGFTIILSISIDFDALGLILHDFRHFGLGAQKPSRMLDFTAIHAIFVDFDAIG